MYQDKDATCAASLTSRTNRNLSLPPAQMATAVTQVATNVLVKPCKSIQYEQQGHTCSASPKAIRGDSNFDFPATICQK